MCSGHGGLATFCEPSITRDGRAAAQQHRDPLEDILRRLSQVVYIHDIGQQRNVWVNTPLATTLGYDLSARPELRDNPLPSLMHPEDLQQMPELLAKLMALRDHEALEREARVRAANGEWRWMRSRSSIYRRNPDGTPELVAGHIEDITEQRRIEVYLQRSARIDTLGQLASGIVHDFNNVLTGAIGYASLLQTDFTLLDTDRPDAVLRAAREAAPLLNELLETLDRATHMTGRLLSLSREHQHQPEGF